MTANTLESGKPLFTPQIILWMALSAGFTVFFDLPRLGIDMLFIALVLGAYGFVRSGRSDDPGRLRVPAGRLVWPWTATGIAAAAVFAFPGDGLIYNVALIIGLAALTGLAMNALRGFIEAPHERFERAGPNGVTRCGIALATGVLVFQILYHYGDAIGWDAIGRGFFDHPWATPLMLLVPITVEAWGPNWINHLAGSAWWRSTARVVAFFVAIATAGHLGTPIISPGFEALVLVVTLFAGCLLAMLAGFKAAFRLPTGWAAGAVPFAVSLMLLASLAWAMSALATQAAQAVSLVAVAVACGCLRIYARQRSLYRKAHFGIQCPLAPQSALHAVALAFGFLLVFDLAAQWAASRYWLDSLVDQGRAVGATMAGFSPETEAADGASHTVNFPPFLLLVTLITITATALCYYFLEDKPREGGSARR